MTAALSIFSERPRADAILPGMIRAKGNIHCRFAANPRRTEASELYEAGGYRMKFPKGALCEGVIINTGGGMAGGLLQGVIDEHNVKLATIKPQYQRKSDTSQGGARPADDWEVDETLRDNRGGFSPMFKD